MSFDNIDQRFKPKTATSLACLRCYSTDGVEMENSRTQYHFEGDQNSPDNPNAPVPLCRACAIDHHEYWDSMWGDYYGYYGYLV